MLRLKDLVPIGLAFAGVWLAFHPDHAYAALGTGVFNPSGTVGSQLVGVLRDVFAGAQWLGYSCAGVGGTLCGIQAMGGRPPTNKAMSIGGGAAGVGVVGSAVNGLLPTQAASGNITGSF